MQSKLIMIIRPAAPDDLSALRDLFLRSRRTAFVWVPPSSLELEDFDRQTMDEAQWVALDDERPVGFISVWEPANFIHHLHVDPVFARQGIGRALLRALPGWPSKRYRLKCVSLNAAALAFYRANRFKQVGEGRADDQDYLLLESSGEHDR